jgi:hypothetical protein
MVMIFHHWPRRELVFFKDLLFPLSVPPLFLEFTRFHMYADDLQIYHSQPKDRLPKCI